MFRTHKHKYSALSTLLYAEISTESDWCDSIICAGAGGRREAVAVQRGWLDEEQILETLFLHLHITFWPTFSIVLNRIASVGSVYNPYLDELRKKRDL